MTEFYQLRLSGYVILYDLNFVFMFLQYLCFHKQTRVPGFPATG